MKLETKKQDLATFPKFMLRVGNYALFGSVLIFISLLFGTLGYKYLCDLNWLDSFYMASMILTGMGPVVALTNPISKIFSSIYALYSGLAFLSLTAVFLAPIIHRLLHILHLEDHNKN